MSKLSEHLEQALRVAHLTSPEGKDLNFRLTYPYCGEKLAPTVKDISVEFYNWANGKQDLIPARELFDEFINQYNL